MMLLEIAFEGLVGEFNASQPLYRIHAIPTGNKSAKRKTMIGGQGGAIHFVRKKCGGVHRSLEWDSAREVSIRRHTLFAAGIRSVQDDRGRRGFRAGLLEQF